MVINVIGFKTLPGRDPSCIMVQVLSEQVQIAPVPYCRNFIFILRGNFWHIGKYRYFYVERTKIRLLTMNRLEFDLLDELYFVKSYNEISDSLEWEDKKILKTLQSVYAKGWLRCYLTPTQEILDDDDIDIEKNYKKYFYLASKAGLFAHNSNEF